MGSFPRLKNNQIVDIVEEQVNIDSNMDKMLLNNTIGLNLGEFG